MKTLMFAVVGAVLVGSLAVSAGEACCPGGKAAADVKAVGGCAAKAGADTPAAACPMLAKLNLTDEQAAKLKVLCAECKKGDCSAEAREKMLAAAKEFLTAEQLAQLEKSCTAKAKGACGVAKKACKMAVEEK